jgi:hypothetical protein
MVPEPRRKKATLGNSEDPIGHGDQEKKSIKIAADSTRPTPDSPHQDSPSCDKFNGLRHDVDVMAIE